MADTVDSVVMFSGRRRYAARFTNVSDGTGESAVVKIDKSTLVGPDGTEPSRLVIEELVWNIQGFTSVRLFWDHTTDDEIDVLSGGGSRNYTEVGGLVDPASAGGTGDIVLTTAGAVSGATYDISIVVRLKD
jgi:hypothetical protein